jgi:hypothetical protein
VAGNQTLHGLIGPTAALASADDPEQRKDPRPPAPNNGAAAEVLRILRETGYRMTPANLMAEITDRGLEFHERTITRVLKDLQAAGWADHDALASPPGYGATPWEG